MKVLILGASGQLGQDLIRQNPYGWQLVPTGRADVDVTQPETVIASLEQHRPDVVINCAAYNLVDLAEKEPQQAFASNAIGVKHLAEQCQARRILLVQVSTDYVFGGESNRNTPYTEEDVPSPIGTYGMSKRMGEINTFRFCPDHHLIIRTCGLYGMHGAGGKGKNFPKIIFDATTTKDPARLAKPFNVVTDEVGTPTFCEDLARGIFALLEKGCRGLFHVTNTGFCSRLECATEIARFAQEKGFSPRFPGPTTQVSYGLPTRRPEYAVLSNEKFLKAVGWKLPDWKDALRRYLELLVVGL